MPATDLTFQIVLFLAAVFASAVAALSGFGIGSILTPLLSTQVEIKLAVAAISIPHLIATTLRFVMLKEHVNRSVLIKFGTFSAVGGLAGALFNAGTNNPLLVYFFSAVLVYVGLSGLLGWLDKMLISRRWSWLAGIASGALGGMVGNQGGIRSAALLGFGLSKSEFVATGTAIGIVVDLARMPVYLATEGQELSRLALPIAVASAACVTGTLVGKRVLSFLPEATFRRVVYALILALGAYMTTQAQRGG